MRSSGRVLGDWRVCLCSYMRRGCAGGGRQPGEGGGGGAGAAGLRQ